MESQLASLEGILFAMGDAVEITAIAKALDISTKQVLELADALGQEGGGWPRLRCSIRPLLWKDASASALIQAAGKCFIAQHQFLHFTHSFS